jgi:hypothetical protein
MGAKWRGSGGFGVVFRNCTHFEQKMPTEAADWTILT